MALTKLRSLPAPVPSTPPMKSMVSAICSAVRLPAPWSSSVAVSIATPSLFLGSCAAPALMIMRTLIEGCSFWLTSTTCRPLASLRISYGGKVTGRAGSGRGGFSRGQFDEETACAIIIAVAADKKPNVTSVFSFTAWLP